MRPWLPTSLLLIPESAFFYLVLDRDSKPGSGNWKAGLCCSSQSPGGPVLTQALPADLWEGRAPLSVSLQRGERPLPVLGQAKAPQCA